SRGASKFIGMVRVSALRPPASMTFRPKYCTVRIQYMSATRLDIPRLIAFIFRPDVKYRDSSVMVRGALVESMYLCVGYRQAMPISIMSAGKRGLISWYPLGRRRPGGEVRTRQFCSTRCSDQCLRGQP